MKTWRPSLTALVLSLLVGLVGERGPADAVVSIASTGTTLVPYAGTVDGPPESVTLSGHVRIAFKVVRDPDFGKAPVVLLSIDLSNVSGIGAKTGRTYVTSGGQNLQRPLVATDVVEITFAFYPSGPGGALRARQALASFTLTYDVGTGSLSNGVASSEVNAAARLDPLNE